ncbi:MAG: glycosyltransferase family 4 protein, partial [Clostridiales bacterium]|nr:glycosyltransferase family 4 protein [Clostridiales bacterium]
AMACGTPVLTSTEASLPEVVGDCAVSVDAYSIKSIADGLGMLYSDKSLRSDLSDRGFERSKEFTWSNAGKKLYSIYEEVLK